MRIDKGNMTMNILFGIFMAVSITNLGFSIYLKSKELKPQNSCKCGAKR